MKSNGGTIELVIFSINGNFSDEQVITAASKLNDFVKDQPGFISRTLSKGDKNRWKDLVYWTDLESAIKAAEKIMQEPCAIEFMEMIDESTMQFYHFEPKLRYIEQ